MISRNQELKSDDSKMMLRDYMTYTFIHTTFEGTYNI